MSETQLNKALLDGLDIISKLQSIVNENKIKLDPTLERKLKLFREQTANITSRDRSNSLRPNLLKSKSMNAMVGTGIDGEDSKDKDSNASHIAPSLHMSKAFATSLTAAVIEINETLKPIDLSSVHRLFDEAKEFNESTIAEIDADIFCKTAKQYNITIFQAQRILSQLQSMAAKESPEPGIARLNVKQPRLLKSKSLNSLQGLEDPSEPLLWKKEKWLRDKDKLDGIMNQSHKQTDATKPRDGAVPPLLKSKSMNVLQDREDTVSNDKELDQLKQTIKELKKQLKDQDADDATDTKESITITITPANGTMDANDIDTSCKQIAKDKEENPTDGLPVKDITHRIHNRNALRPYLLDIASMKQLENVENAVQRQQLMQEKLKLCEYICDFNKTTDETEAQCFENKVDLLLEVLQCMSGNKWNNIELLQQCIATISINLFRSLPSPEMIHTVSNDDEPDFPDPSWGHAQLIYELAFHVVTNTAIDKEIMQKHIQGAFLENLIHLFSSADYREPQYVKIIVHAIYGRFMGLRKSIQTHFSNYCYQYIYLSTLSDDGYMARYMDKSWQGLPEILEIFCSIFQGLNVPVKMDYHIILRNVIVPLHKSFHLDEFHEQLLQCCVQFVAKDPYTAPIILGGILKFWPHQSPLKEQLFITEMVHILNVCVNDPNLKQTNPMFARVTIAVLNKFVECMTSPHHQVAERSAMVWRDETIRICVDKHREKMWPNICKALQHNKEKYWLSPIRNINREILSEFMRRDPGFFETINKQQANNNDKQQKELQKQSREQRWVKLRQLAKTKK